MARSAHVRVLEEELLHRGRVFDLVRRVLELPSGLRQVWELVEHPGAVAVVALTDRGEVVVVRQFRAAAGDWMVEIPAGRLDPGEDPRAAAERELEEETGLRAGTWRHVRTFLPAPGFCSERMHLFEARDLVAVPGGGRACDEDEEIEVLALPAKELLQLEPADAKTLLAALWVLGLPPIARPSQVGDEG